MILIFFQTLPFFALIGCGYLAVRLGYFSEKAIIHLTQFVFYFALSAMLFDFASRLPISEIFDLQFMLAYGSATMALYLVVFTVAMIRGCEISEASVEAQCGVIGNTGFLAIPMLILLFGDQAAAPVLMVLTVDLVVFGSLIVAVITGSRDGRLSLGIFKTIGLGLLKNPMIMAILAGLIWSLLGIPRFDPFTQFFQILGAAATPCALFAIGGSLVARNAERVSVALWISFSKLFLHPIAVAIAAYGIFDVETFAAGIMIAAAAMPVAGNIYIVAQHYNVAPQRASSSILISTIISVITLTMVIGLVSDPVG